MRSPQWSHRKIHCFVPLSGNDKPQHFNQLEEFLPGIELVVKFLLKMFSEIYLS